MENKIDAMTALRRRILKDSGIDPEKLTLEDVAIQNLQLKDEFRSIKDEKRKISSKKYISMIVSKFDFPNKQKNLMKALSGCKPVKEKELIRRAGIKRNGNKSSASLRNLVREIRMRIAKIKNGEKTMVIKPLRRKPFKGYQLEIRAYFVKSPITKT